MWGWQLTAKYEYTRQASPVDRRLPNKDMSNFCIEKCQTHSNALYSSPSGLTKLGLNLQTRPSPTLSPVSGL